MALGAFAAALKVGLSPGEVAVYGGGIDDFTPLVAKARGEEVDAWIAFGEKRVAPASAGIVIRRALFRLPARVHVAQIPRVTFTDPEIAQVGLTEAEARAGNSKITVYRTPFRDNDRANTEGATDGMIKVVCDRGGKVLGAGIAGSNAGELIQIWSMSIAKGLNIKAMTAFIAPYPTLGEISKRAAFGALASDARRPAVRRLLSFLRRFG